MAEQIYKCFVFDTETTGLLPDNFMLEHVYAANYDFDLIDDFENPLAIMISTAFNVIDFVSEDGKFVRTDDVYRSKADMIANWNVPISPKITELTRNSVEKCELEGIKPRDVIVKLMRVIELCDCIVAHNVSYDIRILGHSINYAEKVGEISKEERDEFIEILFSKEAICTSAISAMLFGTRIWKGQFSRSRLDKLYLRFFKKNFEDAHTAYADTNALTDVFAEMVKMYWNIFLIYKDANTIINNIDPHRLREVRKQIDYLDTTLRINSEERLFMSSVLINYHRVSLVNAANKMLVDGTNLGSYII